MIKRRPCNQPPVRPVFTGASRDSPQKSPVSAGLCVPRILIRGAEQNLQQEYHTLPQQKHWSESVLALAYVHQSDHLKDGLKGTLNKLESGAINLMCCHTHTIPQNLKQLYTTTKLIELVKGGFEAAADCIDPSKRLETLSKLFQEQPSTAFAFHMLVRAFLQQSAKIVVPLHSIDYLGNELELLKDYSCSFEYKLFKIASHCFHLKLEIVYIHESGEHTELYNQDDYATELSILKKNDRVQFRLTRIHAASTDNLYRATISTDTSAKDTLRQMIGREKEHFGISLQVPITNTDRSKPIVRSRDRSNDRSVTPQTRDKPDSKCCLKCGQPRRPQQKFCACRKLNPRVPSPRMP